MYVCHCQPPLYSCEQIHVCKARNSNCKIIYNKNSKKSFMNVFLCDEQGGADGVELGHELHGAHHLVQRQPLGVHRVSEP